MRTGNQAFTLAAMLVAFAANAVAEDDPVTELTQPDSSVSIGAGYTSGDREQFGIFDDLRESEAMLLFDADVNRRDDATGTWMTLRARNLGIDNRSIDLGYERQGDWGVGLNYYELPRVAPYTVNTGVTGLGSTLQSVPATIVPGTGTDVTLETERQGAGFNIYKFLAPNLNFLVEFKNEEKDGDRHWGYRGSSPVFVAEPIDSTIRQVDARLEYAASKLQLTGGYNGSWYNNHNSLLQVDGNGGPNYLSLPLDNQAHQFYLNGGYNFTSTTRGTFRASYTRASMDEYLPTAGIAGLADPAAPTSIDGEVNTTVLFLGLTARPMNNLSVVANLHYRKVDDQTPAVLVVPSEPVHVKANDYETIAGKLEGTYRLPDGYSLIAGIDRRDQDRTRPLLTGDETWVPFRTDVDETTYRAQLRKSLSERLNGALAFLHSERDGSTYIPTNVAVAEPETNMINPINTADRDRNKWRLTVDWMATDNFGLQLNYEESRDDYGPASNPYGLTDGDARLVSLDADLAINQDWRLTAWASYDETNAAQEYNNTSSRLKDTGTSLGLGIDGKASPRLNVGADLEWTRSKSEYEDMPSAAYSSGITPLPDIRSRTTRLNLFAEYSLNKNSDLRLDVVHERWRTDDWTWEFSDGTPFIYGTTIDGTSVYADERQSSTFVGARYIYKFR